jgi:hypothetical protein
VIAACFRPTAESLERTRAPIAVATTSHIKRYIEQHLASPELSPASICAAFGLSRATLYRLFEPLGGIASSIRERRLARTYAELIFIRPTSIAVYPTSPSTGVSPTGLISAGISAAPSIWRQASCARSPMAAAMLSKRDHRGHR